MSNSLAEHIARMLIDVANQLSPPDFAKLLERVLADSSTSDVARIAECLPVTLLPLLPKRFLH